MLHISIHETLQEQAGKGYLVSISDQNGKKQVSESDFFANGSEIETKIQQLKKLLRQHFDTNP